MFLDVLSVVGLLMTALSVFFLGVQLRLQARQRRLDLGMFYVERFWTIDDGVIMSGDDPSGAAVHRCRYLRLTEDEFDAQRLGSLDDRMWQVWHATFSSTGGRDELMAALTVTQADESDYVHIRACLQAPVGHSPSSCPGTSG